MRYHALCCDYDGTLAHDGVLASATVAALERVIASGRRLLLVTGRELGDLQRVMPRLDLFARVVAENGALLHDPATGEERCLAEPPPQALVEALRQRGVSPLSVGRAIVATWEPHDAAVLEVIRELGLERQVIFNKGAVMVLPSGINKATGLSAALDSLGLSPHNAIGIGDAENDHAFLSMCECAVAVANALPAIKDAADVVTRADHGAGVVELIDELLADDLASRRDRLARHRIPLGHDLDGDVFAVEPYGSSVLIAGTSGSGKSTVTTGFVERLAERRYSFCVIDPEGDYERLPAAVSLGTPERAPSIDEAVQLLERRENAVLNLIGLPLDDRPAFFEALKPRLEHLRAQSGKPHWVVIDEAHHIFPAARPKDPRQALTQGVVLISVHPDLIAPAALAGVDVVVSIGAGPADNLHRFAEATGRPVEVGPAEVEQGEGLVWQADHAPAARRVRLLASRSEHLRHLRKYAEGELGPERSFWFRGPARRLNLRAQNLIVFLQMADGVDDETFDFHRRQGDYSRWFADSVKDDALAAVARKLEAESSITAAAARAELRAAIEKTYTLPAAPRG